MYSLLMSASFNRLLVFRPVQQRVLMLVLAGVGALAAIAVVLSDMPWWGRALASAVAGAILVLEVCHLRRVPSSLQRLPNGVWLTYPSFTKVRVGEKKSTKCMLLRHFLVGNLSITMVLKDSRGRKSAVWLLKSACTDSEWRRLRVLLRWSECVPEPEV